MEGYGLSADGRIYILRYGEDLSSLPPVTLYVPPENYVKAAKSNKKGKELSWVPIRNGDIYCAPACGGKCSYDDFLQAEQEALWLADEIGNGWQPRVWENVGWHCSARYSALDLEMEMHHKKGSSYWADLKLDGIYQIIVDGDNPRKMVDELIKRATKLRDRLSAALNTLPLPKGK